MKELEAFSYSVSHDLRAPLRAISGFADALFQDNRDSLNSEGIRFIEIIRKNVEQMGELIDDLLAFSRAGRQDLAPCQIDLNHLLEDLLGEFRNMGLLPDSKQLTLVTRKLPVILGDRAMIRQVLINLLSNAIKFTGKTASRQIEIGSESNEKEDILYFKDNGAGFDMKYVGKLFGVFQRLHGESEFEGTGVGLAIVQRVVKRHGGRVWAEGQVNGGASFYFAIPRGGGET